MAAAELARQALPAVAQFVEGQAAIGELVVDVVGVEQREQRIGLRIEVTGGVGRGQQHPDMRVHAASPVR